LFGFFTPAVLTWRIFEARAFFLRTAIAARIVIDEMTDL
jgi:hypothetical protein